MINSIRIQAHDDEELGKNDEILYDNSDDNLLSSSQIKASQKDIETFSQILAEGENISQIKDEAVASYLPKPLTPEQEMEVYIDNQDQTINQADAAQQEIQVVQIPDTKATASIEKYKNKKLKEKKEEQNSENIQKPDTQEQTTNTEKWADAEPKREKQPENKKEKEIDTSKLSKEEYDKLFHEAAQNNELATKSFDDLQKEDLLAINKQKQEDNQEQQKEIEFEQDDPLSKSPEKQESNDPDPGNLENVDMAEAIHYTDQAVKATGKSAQNKDIQPKKVEEKVQTKTEVKKALPAKKSFFEQLLDSEIQKDPQALEKLSKEIKDDKPKAEPKPIPKDKTLAEQLYDQSVENDV